MYLLLGNPNDSPVHVDVTYLLPDGAPPIVIPYDIAANSRRTINVEQEHPGLANTAVSAKVVANLPIVSERAMYWPDGQWWEAHNSVGLTATATKWGLAEGRVGGQFGFETYVLVANPSSQAANLRVTFLRNGAPPIVKEGVEWTVGAGGRFTIGVTPTWNMAGFYDGEFGVVVESLERGAGRRRAGDVLEPARSSLGRRHERGGHADPVTPRPIGFESPISRIDLASRSG